MALRKEVSGLPKGTSDHPFYNDVHMATAKGLNFADSADIRMGTAKGFGANDIRMETARGAATLKQGRFKLRERELLESAEVKRKATVAQLCESVLGS